MVTLSAIGRYESPWIEFTNGKKLKRSWDVAKVVLLANR